MRQPQKFFEPFSAQGNEQGRRVSLSQDTRYTMFQSTTTLATSIQVNYSGEMIAQIHEHSEWVTANHLSISHLTDGRTDGNTDRKLAYLRFAIVLLRKVSAICLSVCGRQRYDLPLSICPAPSRVLDGLIESSVSPTYSVIRCLNTR